jgi:hypothetical protein
MSKNKKRIVRLTESEMVDLIERIVTTVKEDKKEALRESKREATRRRVMAEANDPRRNKRRKAVKRTPRRK